MDLIISCLKEKKTQCRNTGKLIPPFAFEKIIHDLLGGGGQWSRKSRYRSDKRTIKRGLAIPFVCHN